MGTLARPWLSPTLSLVLKDKIIILIKTPISILHTPVVSGAGGVAGDVGRVEAIIGRDVGIA